MYPPDLVKPMAEELVSAGFTALNSADQVDSAVKNNEGTHLLVVNSVCGCAAGSMRPGVLLSLASEASPQSLTTVFAGVDKEATDRARQYMLPYPPSSPSIALFKDGKLMHMVERHHIEGNSAETIAEHLKSVYKEFQN
ncbi:MAG: putative YphP/YqiW family bacilliredoxin [Patiriisocius sp.]|jgi:putative YphP/YqiW family bacilliredoxin